MTDSGEMSDRLSIRDLRQACSTCSLTELCLPVALGAEDIDALDNIVQRRKSLHSGSVLYHAGERFSSLYAVRAGALRTSILSEDGVEHITAFHLPGEMMGLDAISQGQHPSTAIVLETTNVCEIPFHDLERLSERIPGLQRQLLRIMSREIFNEQEMLQTLARRTAEQRLAIVLLKFGDRFSHRHLAKRRFRLPMSRHDLSNYLGLTPETMSRLFRRFAERNWIRAYGREVELLDVAGLRYLTGTQPESRACSSY